MVNDEQIALFSSLFRGRSDVYARYWEKNGRSGYSPAYSFNWNEFMAHKRSGGSIKTFENKTLLPLTPEVFGNHLDGRLLAGIYPILEDGTCYFLAADFDGEHWLDDARAYMQAAIQAGLATYLEKSKSGNGGHVWIFFTNPYPCYKSRRIGLELVRRALNISDFDKEVSFDRLFPNQDSVPNGGFGNLIALPLQGEYANRGTMVFIDLESSEPIPDQWAYLSKIKKHGANELDNALALLECVENDAPVRKHRTNEKIALVVRNRIELERKFVTPNITHFIRDNLNFLNPEYLVRKRMGKSTYKVEKYFKLVDEVGENVFIPRGFLNKLSTFLDSEHMPFEVIREHAPVEPTKFSSSITLTEPQRNIVEKALQSDEGMIVAPPGSGKTMVGMELIARRGLPALVLVHRKELLEQWVERIQTFLNIPKTKIGRFCGTKKKRGAQITVGLLQSFSRAKDLSDYTNAFGTIIIDECHHIPAATFRAVIVRFNPHYLYGLTATPKRKWGDEKIIHAYIGDTIAFMEKGVTSEPAILTEPKMKLDIVVHDTGLQIPFAWKTDRFQLLAKIISFDTERNRLIAGDILVQVTAGERVLVLSERKEHLDILHLCLKGACETILISGDDSSAQRFRKLKRIKSGNYQVILSTGQFFGEGMDIHNITVLVLAFPFSFEGKLMQYIGRLLHGVNPKRVIDYRDRNVEFLERQYKQRQRYYNKLRKE